MKPILIRKDDHLIKQEKENLQNMLVDGQAVLDHFKTVNIELTPVEIHDFLHKHANHVVKTNHVHNFITDKMIERAGRPEFNGVPIKKEKLADLIEIPDTTIIKKAIEDIGSRWQHNTQSLTSFKAKYVEVVDGKLNVKAGVQEAIEDQHTHYTKTERGYQVATKLLDVSKNIHELSNYFGQDKKGNNIYQPHHFNIPGLKDVFRPLPKEKQYYINNGSEMSLVNREHIGHQLDLDFIRRQEARAEDSV